jgi:4-hydroxy-3-polyprenylbenzoate decarboxylase
MAEVIDQTARRAIDLLDLDLHLPAHEWEGEDRAWDAGQR